MKKAITILSILILITDLSLFSQIQTNMYYRGEMNAWGSTSMTFRDLGTDSWIVSIQSDGDDGTSQFKFDNTTNWSGSNWGRGSTVNINTYDIWYGNGADGDFNEADTKYYTFTIKDVASGNTNGLVMETSGNPISISNVSQVGIANDVSFYASTATQTVNITLSGPKSSEEKVYVRYSTDGFTNDGWVEASGSGTSYSANIPTQSIGATVEYYVLTTTLTSTGSGDLDNHPDLCTINFNNNSGSNYSYIIGRATTQAGDWNTTSTWLDGAVPSGSTDDVIITNDVTIDEVGATDAECDDLSIASGATLTLDNSGAIKHTIHGTVVVFGNTVIRDGSFFDITKKLKIKTSGDLEIQPGGELTVDGTTSVEGSGTLTILSTSSGTGSFIPVGTVTGDVTVQRYLTQDRWHYISEPVNDTRVFNEFLGLTSGANNDQFYWWDEDATGSGTSGTGIWFDILNSPTGISYTVNSFIPAQGYAINYSSSEKTISFLGAPFTESKNLTITLTTGSSGEGSNMVGNPFSSDIAINNLADGTNNFIVQNAAAMDDTYGAVYIWNEQAGWDGSSIEDYDEITIGSAASFLQPGQAFMVVAASNTSINFNTNIRKHGDATFNKNHANYNGSYIELFAKNSHNQGNKTTITFIPDMTIGLDPSYDAGKLKGNPNLALYTRLVEDIGVDFGTQALPDNNIQSYIIPIGIDVADPISIEFNLNHKAMDQYPIFLEDRQEKTFTNLKEESYSTLVSQSGIGRFFLHFRDVTDIYESNDINNLKAYSINNDVVIINPEMKKGQINIVDLGGKLISSRILNGDSKQEISINTNAGLYLVNIITDEGINISYKVIISN